MEFGEFGLTAKRGRILAADGSPLAYTVRAWRFYLDPRAADLSVYDTDCFREIAEGLGVPVQSLLAAYARNDRQNVFLLCCEAAHELGVPMQPLFDASEGRGNVAQEPPRHIFLSEAADNGSAVEYFDRRHPWLTKCAGLIREPVQKRVYPLGAAAVSVVGFMHGGAHTDRPKGAGGLEWACDKSLAGTDGIYDKRLPQQERYRNAKPRPGADIQTTLVPGLQKAAAEALSAACATNGAESAFALVMKVPLGEIAAMASWPTFDPSMRRDLDKWDSEMAMNRAAQTVFEPGGLAKPIVEAIALDSGVAADVTNAVSSVGVKKFHAALRRFGFGSKTGTAGIPGEEVGILTSKPEYWEIDTTAPESVGMGHGFAVTGLQLAQAYATLANRGTLVRPTLIAEGARSCATNDITQVVPPTVADAIMRMLKSPIHAVVPICEHDRESGRSFYSPTSCIASCAGIVPAESYRYVVVASFSKPRLAHNVEEASKPVFKSISDQIHRRAVSGDE